jgi:ABC-2 type transport system permease protein
VSQYADELFSQVQPVHVATRGQALADIRSGDVLAAVVIPRNIAARIASDISPGSIEVIYNGNALEQSLVQSELNSALAQANLGFSEQIQHAAAQAIGVLITGGNLGVLGVPSNMIGLGQIPSTLHTIIARLPAGAQRAQLQRVEAFAEFADRNLGLAKNVLSTIGQPIQVKSTLVQGRRTPLNTFAVVVAVSVSLMFVCVLLAAGGVALEREENTLARLTRGTVRGGKGGISISREGLLVEKLLLAAVCSFALALAMLAGIGVFVHLDWSRIGQWLVALALGALAFAALGIAIGALAREVRAASLLAFLLSLPLAFLALVPSGSVSHGLYVAIEAISFVFPFKAALQALDAAVNGASPGLAVSVAHLAGLTLLFGILARVGLRRLD